LLGKTAFARAHVGGESRPPPAPTPRCRNRGFLTFSFRSENHLPLRLASKGGPFMPFCERASVIVADELA